MRLIRAARLWIVACTLSTIMIACSSPQVPQAPTASNDTAQVEPSPIRATEALPTAASVPSDVPAASPTEQTDIGGAGPTETIVPLARNLSLQNPYLEGEDVKTIQSQLLNLGYHQVGVADGIFGPQTEQAVRSFQSANKLDVDGIVGPQTYALLISGEALANPSFAFVLDSQTKFLLGGSSNGAWYDPKDAATQLLGQEQYRLYTLAGQAGIARGSQAQGADPGPCEHIFTVELDPQPSERTIAVASDWDPLPRTPRQVEPSPELQQALTTWLTQQGIAQPELKITQSYEIDLQGDGSPEIVLAATRYAGDYFGPSAQAGDYSGIWLWNPTSASLQELESEVYPSADEFIAPNRFTLLAVLDLNGDGELELVIDVSYYEGAATEIYTFNSSGFQRVIGEGCGV
jgi:peptidoglycan hydrolase-like protein with peptidoglycan-binding domain